MKIAIMGAGALGGYFGGRLAQAGHDVWLIARGAHLKALQSDGLRIVSPKGDAHIKNIHAVGSPDEVGVADIVFFMVKNRDVEPAASAIKPMLGDNTTIVTCQNGLSAWERLGDIVGRDYVLPGVARIPGEVTEPGLVTHTAPFDALVFGEPDGQVTPRVETLQDILAQAGTSPQIAGNIIHELWSKFCAQSSLASLTTLTGQDIGPLRSTPESEQLFKDAIAEAFAVGKAIEPDLPEDIPEKNWAFVQALPPHMHASMLDDLRNGKPLEHDYLSGEVVKLGRECGVPTPIHSVLYAALKPIADRLEP